jgi:hypothetical protein
VSRGKLLLRAMDIPPGGIKADSVPGLRGMREDRQANEVVRRLRSSG